jgi:hypothetical protein
MQRSMLAAIAAAVLAMSASANAAVIINGGFETGSLNPGWLDYNPVEPTQVVTNFEGFAPYEGSYFALLDGDEAQLVQTSSDFVELEAGDIMVGYVAARFLDFDTGGTPQATVGFYLSGGAKAANEFMLTASGLFVTDGGVTTRYNLPAVQTPWMQISWQVPVAGYYAVNAHAANVSVLIDDFQIANQQPNALSYPGLTVYQPPSNPPGNSGVPEPAAWALMLLGFGSAGLALRQRRRMVYATVR